MLEKIKKDWELSNRVDKLTMTKLERIMSWAGSVLMAPIAIYGAVIQNETIFVIAMVFAFWPMAIMSGAYCRYIKKQLKEQDKKDV